MAPKSLAKVQKRVLKKKKAKAGALHEYSRDSRRLHRAELRENRIGRTVNEREAQNREYYNRIATFAAAAKNRDIENDPFELDEVQELIESYIGRTEAELAELAATRRPGRPPAARQAAIENRAAAEREEYRAGMWVPDMLDLKNVAALAGWSGDWAALGCIAFVRVSQAGSVKKSIFPPNGRS